MKYFSCCLIIFLSLVQNGCKTSHSGGFIKKSKQRIVVLKDIYNPKILFLLQNNDTLKFSKKDAVDVINRNYPSSKSLKLVADSLKDESNLLVVQNVSEVNSLTVSGALEIWIARELLLKGKAEVIRSDHQKIKKLKYVYTKDALGGEQGNFYSIDNKLIFTSVISLGE